MNETTLVIALFSFGIGTLSNKLKKRLGLPSLVLGSLLVAHMMWLAYRAPAKPETIAMRQKIENSTVGMAIQAMGSVTVGTDREISPSVAERLEARLRKIRCSIGFSSLESGDSMRLRDQLEKISMRGGCGTHGMEYRNFSDPFPGEAGYRDPGYGIHLTYSPISKDTTTIHAFSTAFIDSGLRFDVKPGKNLMESQIGIFVVKNPLAEPK